ncbi:hypothetical protein [Primorskyibacter sp. S187A]|uniref:hypothetical protein n=1 Tax=Primorskyibacter sp. S187A TaxID=3415130 RepID=UPI003C7DD590
MTRLFAGLLVCAALAACGGQDKRITFDGEFFRGSAKAVDRSDRTVFDAVVRGVSKSEAGAREAVAYEGTKYCIKWFGVSEIVWETSPDAESLPLDGDSLTLRGRCIE